MLTQQQTRVAIAMYHGTAPLLEAKHDRRLYDEVWEVVGSSAFYNALALAENRADHTGHCVKVVEFDEFHNYIKAEVIYAHRYS